MKIVNITLNKLANSFKGGVQNPYKSKYKMPPMAPSSPEHDMFIKQKVEESKTTQQEAYNNLANIQDKIPKNELGAQALQEYLNGEIDYEVFLKKVSVIHELYLLNGSRSYDVDAFNNVRLLEETFQKGGVEASNYEMAAHLVEEQKLHPECLTFNRVKGSFTDQFVEDLDKIFEAQMDGKDLKDVFVPKFDSATKAKNTLKTGEVCSIGDNDNISIKLKDGSMKELFITPDTYMELFPPAQRFALSQGATGDCFLISAFNSAYLNPNARHLVLEMFKENPDGTLDVSIGGFKKEKGQVILKNPRSYEMKDAQNNAFSEEDINNNFVRFVSQFEGFRVLEATTRQGSEHDAYERIKKHYSVCKQNIEKLQDDKDSVTIKGQNYTKREMQAFIDLCDDIDDKDCLLQTMVSLKDLFIDFDLGINEAKGLLAALKKAQQTSEDEEYVDVAYLEEALQRGLDYAKKYKKDAVRIDFMPYTFYNQLTGEDIDSEIDYINGGTSAAVFRKMGLKTQIINTTTARRQGETKLNQAFADKNFNSKYLAGVSSFGNDRSKIIQAHAYGLQQIEQIERDGKIMYAFINPHNGAKQTVVSPHQLKKAFCNFEFALIE